jgi:paraquat-inducible protein B
LVATLEKELSTNLDRILGRLAEVPFEEIGADLQTTMHTLNASLDATRRLLAGFEGQLMPELDTTLQGVQQTLDGLHTSFGTRSALQLELRRSLGDFGAASRAIRNLADFLERHPESLIKGKEE